MTRKKKAQQGPGLNKEGWMVTFADLMTILLTLFALLYSMCSTDSGKLKEVQLSLQGALGVLEKGLFSEYSMDIPIVTLGGGYEEVTPERLVLEIRDDLKSLSERRDVKLKVTDEGVLLTLASKVLFDRGKAEINPGAFPLLDRIESGIKERSLFNVRVEGHTDNLPINTDRFPSNWELSITRAVNLVKYFLKDGEISPERLSAAGYGESKPHFPNISPRFRAKNRRVEILFSPIKKESQKDATRYEKHGGR